MEDFKVSRDDIIEGTLYGLCLECYELIKYDVNTKEPPTVKCPFCGHKAKVMFNEFGELFIKEVE